MSNSRNYCKESIIFTLKSFSSIRQSALSCMPNFDKFNNCRYNYSFTGTIINEYDMPPTKSTRKRNVGLLQSIFDLGSRAYLSRNSSLILENFKSLFFRLFECWIPCDVGYCSGDIAAPQSWWKLKKKGEKTRWTLSILFVSYFNCSFTISFSTHIGIALIKSISVHWLQMTQ